MFIKLREPGTGSFFYVRSASVQSVSAAENAGTEDEKKQAVLPANSIIGIDGAFLEAVDSVSEVLRLLGSSP